MSADETPPTNNTTRPSTSATGTNNHASSYAPRSPDLSSYYAAGPTQTQTTDAPLQQQHPPFTGTGASASASASTSTSTSTSHPIHSIHPQARYKLQPPSYGYGSSSASNPYQYAQPAQQQHSQHSQHTPAAAPHLHQYPSPNLQSTQQAWAPNWSLPSQPSARKSDFPYAAQETYSPPVQCRPEPSSHSWASYGLQNTSTSSSYSTPSYGDQLYTPPSSTAAHLSGAAESEASSSSAMPPRKAAVPPPPPPPAVEPSPVKTKFPTARIKRIMQADEEVGKVAQQTPIAVSKALELFMVQLVLSSAEIAKEKGSKRVTAPMLKQAVEQGEQWDFLREIVGRVENQKEGGRAKAKDSESDEEMEEPKKRGKGGRRKKSVA